MIPYRGLVGLVVAATLMIGSASAALAQATQNPSTGQPSQSCQAQPSSPGNASSAPGSAFNEPTSTSPGGTAGQVYAGNGPHSTANSNSTATVSQYDVACFQVSSH